jgi:hypothetical protein
MSTIVGFIQTPWGQGSLLPKIGGGAPWSGARMARMAPASQPALSK